MAVGYDDARQRFIVWYGGHHRPVQGGRASRAAVSLTDGFVLTFGRRPGRTLEAVTGEAEAHEGAHVTGELTPQVPPKYPPSTPQVIAVLEAADTGELWRDSPNAVSHSP
jgi:hypothetical protein